MDADYKTLRPALLHLLAWVGYALYEQALILFVGNAHVNLLEILLYYLFNAALFYLNGLVLLPQLYLRRRYALYALQLLAALAIYTLLRSYLYVYIYPNATAPLAPSLDSFERVGALSLYRGTFFVMVSAGFWFGRNAVGLEKQKRAQEQQLREAEKNLIEANLAFLKSQINPHFLFNSLNFLYAQVYPISTDAAKGILLLSEIMRYVLDEDNNGKAMLTQEVKHLHNYIEINQLRFSNQLQINFEVIGNIQYLLILPLVLITFVENCFKHGELADAANPLTVRLVVVENRLTFYTHNKKRLGPKDISTGIGLLNTTRRLDMAYQGRYDLVLTDEPDYYSTTLNIAL